MRQCQSVRGEGTSILWLLLVIACVATSCPGATLPITDNLRLWLRADANVYTDVNSTIEATADGQLVARWHDQLVGTDNTIDNLAKASSSNRQPTYRLDAINGLPVVQFINDNSDDNEDDFMNSEGGALLSSGDAARTVFVVARHNGGSESSPAIFELNGQAGGNTTGGQYRVTPEVGLRVSGGYRLYNGSMGTSNFRMISMQTPATPDNDTALTLAWLDGIELSATDTLSQAVNTGTSGYRLAGGTGANPGGSISADIAEIIVYESELSDVDRAAVESYLSTKYRLNTQAIDNPAKPVKVFFLGGQSNMVGQGANADLSTLAPTLNGTQGDVVIWHNGDDNSNTTSGWVKLAPGQGRSGSEFGPELALGRALADAYPDYQIALVKHAVGGTNLDVEWNPNGPGPLYSGFLESVSNALGALDADGLNYDIGGMFWMQGERDSRFTDMAANYQDNLLDLIAAVRSEAGVADLPFVIGRISENLPDATYTEEDIVRAAMDAIAAGDDQVGLVDTDSFGLKSDSVHFNSAGQLALGEAFAAQYLAIAIPEPTTAGLLVMSMLAIGTRTRRRAG
ncbi:sialate O-acetylesterase [Planctomycetales bacterium ZRK34]|nr:sialate O-acetylesterase [Planctomycetales bacterium ZRK34]